MSDENIRELAAAQQLEIDKWREAAENQLKEIQLLQQENHALRSRLTAVALVIRP